MPRKFVAIAVCFIFALGLVSLSMAAAKKGGPSPEQITKVQEGLKALGVYTGDVTGKIDKATTDAIKAFQKDKGMKETGRVSKKLIEALDKAKTEKAGAPPVAEPAAPPAK